MWKFSLTPLKSLDNPAKDIKLPIWLLSRKFFDYPEPSSQAQRKPKVEELRDHGVNAFGYDRNFCSPYGIPCYFIEDSFEEKK